MSTSSVSPSYVSMKRLPVRILNRVQPSAQISAGIPAASSSRTSGGQNSVGIPKPSSGGLEVA